VAVAHTVVIGTNPARKAWSQPDVAVDLQVRVQGGGSRKFSGNPRPAARLFGGIIQRSRGTVVSRSQLIVSERFNFTDSMKPSDDGGSPQWIMGATRRLVSPQMLWN
jgi:hypothetical protein